MSDIETLERVKENRYEFKKDMKCKSCNTWWHVKNPMYVRFNPKWKTLATCPKCTDKYPYHSLEKRRNEMRSSWGLRKVRSDYKGKEHKRKVTRSRVRRWRYERWEPKKWELKKWELKKWEPERLE